MMVSNKIRYSFCAILALLSATTFAKLKHKHGNPEFRADLLVPGKTEESQLERLLGDPMRSLRDRGRTLYFYDVGLEGASMTATVCVRRGVVEYVTYFCDEKLDEVAQRYGDESESRVRVSAVEKHAVRGGLRQMTFNQAGRAFLFAPHSDRARVCIKWEPGKKFSEIGG